MHKKMDRKTPAGFRRLVTSVAAGSAATLATLVLYPVGAQADTVDNEGPVDLYLADSFSPFLVFASTNETHQSGYVIQGQVEPNGDYGMLSFATGTADTGADLNGVNLNAQLFVFSGGGTMDGITGEFTITFSAWVRFSGGGMGVANCQTPSFDFTVTGEFADLDYQSDDFTIPALTTGCVNSTNRTNINSLMDLGTDGAHVLLPKNEWDPVPTGS